MMNCNLGRNSYWSIQRCISRHGKNMLRIMLGTTHEHSVQVGCVANFVLLTSLYFRCSIVTPFSVTSGQSPCHHKSSSNPKSHLMSNLVSDSCELVKRFRATCNQTRFFSNAYQSLGMLSIMLLRVYQTAKLLYVNQSEEAEL